MSKVTVTRQIAAPPEEVFRLASDFARAPEVVRGIDRVEMLTDGPVGVGTRFRETRTMFGRQASEEMEILEFEPPTRYTIGAESHGCRYRTEFRFRPNGGGTDLEMTFEATPVSFFAKAMSPMMAPMLKSVTKCLEDDIDDLKKRLES